MIVVNLVVQCDGSKSEKIRIKTQPRSKFRPRTEKESQESSHYIRSENYTQPGYPSIHVYSPHFFISLIHYNIHFLARRILDKPQQYYRSNSG
jgi:hypothetical protein